MAIEQYSWMADWLARTIPMDTAARPSSEGTRRMCVLLAAWIRLDRETIAFGSQLPRYSSTAKRLEFLHGVSPMCF